MKKASRTIAILVLFFNGISALFGGWALFSDPSGQTVQMPLSFLENSPFKDFLIPGIILFTLIGVFSIIIAILAIRRVKYYGHLTFLEGLILCIWLTVQIIMIKEFQAFLHTLYYLIGILLLIAGWFIIKNETKEDHL